ncbi:MAG: MmgE/PrpD family protein, partial [Chloroflexi bacterium]|nr:MmgE/PrpD family protein [Chloroflexota bacterium]
GAEALAAFLAELTYEVLPEDVREAAKLRLLDFLGAALFGARTEWGRGIAEQAIVARSRGRCTVIGHCWETDPRWAAYVNSVAGRSFEIDDYLPLPAGVIFGGASVISAALAVGEECGITGKEFLAAVVAGYEAQAWAGQVLSNLAALPLQNKSGAVGAGAAAAKALRMSSTQFVHTLGMAVSSVSEAAIQSDDDELSSLRLTARSTEAGVSAALSVAQGRVGSAAAFESIPNGAAQADRLGQEFAITRTCLRLWPGHSRLQAVMQAAGQLAIEAHLPSEEVQEIIAEGPAGLGGMMDTEPSTVPMAMQSLPFSIAFALSADLADPWTYREEWLNNKEARALAQKVAFRSAAAGAAVTVRLRNGQEFRSRVAQSIGTPEHQPNWEQIIAKFTTLATASLPRGPQARVIALVTRLEQVEHIAELGALLRA